MGSHKRKTASGGGRGGGGWRQGGGGGACGRQASRRRGLSLNLRAPPPTTPTQPTPKKERKKRDDEEYRSPLHTHVLFFCEGERDKCKPRTRAKRFHGAVSFSHGDRIRLVPSLSFSLCYPAISEWGVRRRGGKAATQPAQERSRRGAGPTSRHALMRRFPPLSQRLNPSLSLFLLLLGRFCYPTTVHTRTSSPTPRHDTQAEAHRHHHAQQAHEARCCSGGGGLAAAAAVAQRAAPPCVCFVLGWWR